MNLKQLIISKLKKNKEFSTNFIWRVIQTLGKQGTSFVLFLIATAILPKEEMGIYNYAFSALALLTLLSDFGISTATSKYVAQYNIEDKKKLPKVIFNTSMVILLISILITIVTLLWGEIWFKDYYQYIVYILPLVILSPITSLYDGIYRGLKKFKSLSIISIATGVISIGISLFLIKTWGLVGALMAQNVLYLIYTIILTIFYKTGWSFKIDKKIVKEICSYSIAFGIASLGYYLFSRVNILIMGEFDLVEEIATYELINKAFTLYLLPFTILGQVLAPYVTETFSLKKFRDVKKLYFNLGKYLLLLIPIFTVVGIFATRFAIQIFFPIYDTDILTVLLLPVALTYAKHVFGAPIHSGMIVATGDAGIMTIQNIVSGIVNVILSYWTITRYGFVEMMWVTFVLQLISLVVLHLIYIRRLNRYAKT